MSIVLDSDGVFADFDLHAAKKEWWKRHFDHELVVTCLSRDKALHIRRPGGVHPV